MDISGSDQTNHAVRIYGDSCQSPTDFGGDRVLYHIAPPGARENSTAGHDSGDARCHVQRGKVRHTAMVVISNQAYGVDVEPGILHSPTEKVFYIWGSAAPSLLRRRYEPPACASRNPRRTGVGLEGGR